LLEDATVLWYSLRVDTDAGGDVLIPTTTNDGEAVEGIAVTQAKAEKQSSLVECLHSASPAWQYVTGPQRQTVLGDSGGEDPIVWSAKRTAYTDLVRRKPDIFKTAIRIVLCVNDYKSSAVTWCKLNDTPDANYDSPVVLCTNTPAAFGALLSGILKSECEGGRTHGTRKIGMWLPQDTIDITDKKLVVKTLTKAAAELIGDPTPEDDD
jgi:hypothetical protein